MGVTKQLRKAGNGIDKPIKGDKVSIEYTGYLYDSSNEFGFGTKYDSFSFFFCSNVQ